MKPEDLFEAVGDAASELLERSERERAQASRARWVKWGCLAACLCLLALADARFFFTPSPGTGEVAVQSSRVSENSVTSREPSSNPLESTQSGPTVRTSPEPAPEPSGSGGLPVLESGFEFGGMGFDGASFYDASEIGSCNPWSEDAELGTLPVYRNLAYSDAAGAPVFLSRADMLEQAKLTAQKLGVEIESTRTAYVGGIWEGDVEPELPPFPDPNPAQKPDTLVAVTALGDIRVFGNGGIVLKFGKGYAGEAVPLPEEYGFTLGNTTDGEALETIGYLLNRYSGLLELEEPVACSSVEYNFHGEPARSYFAYSGGDLEQRILNYNFSRIFFLPAEKGGLSSIGFSNRGCEFAAMEKLGDYPLIDTAAAREFLLDGESISNVPEEYLADGNVREEDIAGVELVYRTGNLNKIFMPYYRFYVELQEFHLENLAAGLKNYGAFYVPAVSGEYLSDFPVWDGKRK